MWLILFICSNKRGVKAVTDKPYLLTIANDNNEVKNDVISLPFDKLEKRIIIVIKNLL